MEYEKLQLIQFWLLLEFENKKTIMFSERD